MAFLLKADTRWWLEYIMMETNFVAVSMVMRKQPTIESARDRQLEAEELPFFYSDVCVNVTPFP